MPLELLVSPLASAAWFGDVERVALAELGACSPWPAMGVTARGGVQLIAVDAPESALRDLARLSFVQAIFERDGDRLRLLDASADLALPASLVTGAKYRGKTNELMTQHALNLALAHCQVEGGATKLLDPMAGRGTTLQWAVRYGLQARGIELERRALEDLQRHIGRQTKLHRVKHKREKGGGRKGAEFVGYRFGDVGLRLLIGDARRAGEILGGERFDLIVSDLPYGIEHRSGAGGRRDPREVLAACAPEWAARLRPGGSMALIFNRLMPPREVLADPFLEAGLEIIELDLAHRMSESILRDVLIARLPR
jgi:hypothetical protein